MWHARTMQVSASWRLPEEVPVGPLGSWSERRFSWFTEITRLRYKPMALYDLHCFLVFFFFTHFRHSCLRLRSSVNYFFPVPVPRKNLSFFFFFFLNFERLVERIGRRGRGRFGAVRVQFAVFWFDVCACPRDWLPGTSVCTGLKKRRERMSKEMCW